MFLFSRSFLVSEKAFPDTVTQKMIMKTRNAIKTTHVVVLALAAQLFAVAMGGDAPAVSKSVPEGWVEDFEAARLQAAKEGKYVLLAFSGSDWCGPCIALEREVLSQRAFTEELAKRFLLVMVSVPHDKSTLSELALTQNDGLKQRYGVHGFPTLVVVNPADGDAVKRMSGYRAGAPRGFMDRLNEMMLDEGIITQEEFDAKKRQLLGL